ncbi:phosphoribosylaminoimidazolesuccinocarboxamide synthase [Salinisphaera sp. Q1T1-3]|uniref:phosphoribosylaminoimidazolesuccinocarboxamide synthase n=1 Tax=Salinisphaera sp. Q1T1-3 TaxID=2321229 RepID=UPI000E719E20|nr:phosphoribosylaminoimidazolesuccinocarboxamide synthase [Salinisphaera sp. Q1T1-3]RJS93542.1 phosphoribosylaminoimidazolesuccinocarboxamide synthase [Salinisphaera sp. Q1T1-3]
MADTLFQSEIQSLPLVMRGKVRDVYAVGVDHLLIVTTDRLSAFDVILPDPIPGKGRVLTEVSNFWFEFFAGTVADQRADIPLWQVLSDTELAQVEGRAVVVKRLDALPVEAVVRGYVVGSGWKDYQATGAISGIELPAGLRQAEKLAEPIFTPATKAAAGDHDETIAFARMAEIVGEARAAEIRDVSIDLYTRAAAYAAERGILIADTKFEFGLDHNDRLVLIDEALTPDSSRFWPADSYEIGTSPASFDKQYVRDYLETLDWDKTAPGPRLPDDVIANTAAKYAEARDRLIRD